MKLVSLAFRVDHIPYTILEEKDKDEQKPQGKERETYSVLQNTNVQM